MADTGMMARQTNRLSFFAALTALLALALGLALPGPATAQNLFAPAIRVNEEVITQYELNQRALMLQLFRAPGDPAQEARTQLIEERLKLDAARANGVIPSPEEVEAGMEEFAGRANLSTEEFIKALKGGGVERETFRDFIISGVAWRQLVRAKFGPRVQVSDADVTRAISNSGATNVRVLMSEIYIPLTPGKEAQAQALADRLSRITTISAFAQAARKYSAAPSRGRSGKVNWLELNKVPPALRGQILGLAPGQVTQPIPVSGAIALFQLRAIEEGKRVEPDYAAIEYAAYYINGGRTPAALATAKKIEDRIDTCDDLYGVAKGQPPEVLERGSKKPGEIPADIAMELAKLDRNEISTALTRANGQTLVLLMLCDRVIDLGEDVSRDDIALGIQNRRLASYADSYLAQLKSEARIVEK